MSANPEDQEHTGSSRLLSSRTSSDPSETPKVPRTECGFVILLNGASSAGKSTLARSMRFLMNNHAMILSMDDYLSMSQGKYTSALDAVRESGLSFIVSFHVAIAEAARKGTLVIVDHVIGESRRWIQDLLDRLDGIHRVLVKVECRQSILLERERHRTDRTPSPHHAQRQLKSIHRHFPHDIVIDTSESSPRECAMQIIRHLPKNFLMRGHERSPRFLPPT